MTPSPSPTEPSADLQELQRDALREVANIGCGHAANALARLMGGKPVTKAITIDRSDMP